MTQAAGETSGYGYDPASRLQTLTHSFAGGTGNQQLGFGYNPVSQITTRTSSNDAYAYTGDYNITRPYTKNGLNQYTGAGPASFTYDGNGNLTSATGLAYSYDVENRIIGASGSRTANLRYDPNGRLYETGASAVPNGATTRFLYDGDALVAEYSSSGTLLRRYIHGPGVDEPLIWYEGAGLTTPDLREHNINYGRDDLIERRWA
jgi:hypothetical protein